MVIQTVNSNTVANDIMYEELQCGSVHNAPGAFSFLVVISVAWISIFAAIYRSVIVKFSYESALLHHCLMYLAAFKCVNLLLALVSSGVCQSILPIGKYVGLFNIAFETIFRTVFATIICCVADGYYTTYFHIPDALFAAKIMGTSYLIHSLYFVTIDYTYLHSFVRYMVYFFYILVMWVIITRGYKSYSFIKLQIDQMIENPILEQTFGRALKLKKFIISCFLL